MSTFKAVARQLKRQAKPSTRAYCQVCARQFRDKRALRSHQQTVAHEARERALGPTPQDVVVLFSERFVGQFMGELARQAAMSRMPHRAVMAKRVYDALVADPEHVRLAATQWPSLQAFLQWLTVHRADQVALLSVIEPEEAVAASERWLVWLGSGDRDVPAAAWTARERNRRRLAAEEADEAFTTTTTIVAPSTASAVASGGLDERRVEQVIDSLREARRQQRLGRLTGASPDSRTGAAPGAERSLASPPLLQHGDRVQLARVHIDRGRFRDRIGQVLGACSDISPYVFDVEVCMLPEERKAYVLRVDQDDLERLREAPSRTDDATR
eukprot:ctg_602.g246